MTPDFRRGPVAVCSCDGRGGVVSWRAIMSCETFSRGQSIVHRLDPRSRILFAAAITILIAVSSRFSVLAAALILAAAAAGAARLPTRPLLKRLLGVNLFMSLLTVMLPWQLPGETLFHLAGWAYSREGLLLAARIALKANAIALILTTFFSTVEITAMGHALVHLRVPAKLAHLFLFSVRYLDVLRHEYLRLIRAMQVRGFRPGLNTRTCRSLGYLVGMLLVRSIERSERILSAMKCRGFHGRFYVFEHFVMGRRDVLFGLVSIGIIGGLFWMEWLWQAR